MRLIENSAARNIFNNLKESESIPSMKDENFNETVLRDFRLFLMDKYGDELYKDVTDEDVNEYFTGMFYDIWDNDDLDSANAAEDIIRAEYHISDKSDFNESEDSERILAKLVKDLPDTVEYKGKTYQAFNVMSNDTTGATSKVYYCNMENTPNGDPQESNDYFFVVATLKKTDRGYKGVDHINYVEDLTEGVSNDLFGDEDDIDESKVESKRRLRKRFKEEKDLDDVEDSEDIYAYSTREDPNPDPKFIISSNVDGEICRVSTKYDAEHTIETFKIEDRRDKIRKKQNIVYTCTKLDGTPCNFSINEKALNTLFTKFANENYENVKDVVFTSGKVLKDGNIKIEGIVNTKSGKVRSITLESVGFKLSPKTKIIKFVEKGPFTESAKISPNKVPFVVECTIRNKYILVKSLKYNYRLSESNNTYAVYGKHSLFENRKMNSK